MKVKDLSASLRETNMTSEIENVDQYETLLAEAGCLLELNPKLGTRDANRLMAKSMRRNIFQ
jgi:hypothetical protein